jgi:hypothetical protein
MARRRSGENNTYHEITIGPAWTDSAAFVAEYVAICNRWGISTA